MKILNFKVSIFVLAFSFASAGAAPVTFEFTGRVQSVFDGLGALAESVQPEMSFAGSYTFLIPLNPYWKAGTGSTTTTGPRRESGSAWAISNSGPTQQI